MHQDEGHSQTESPAKGHPTLQQTYYYNINFGLSIIIAKNSNNLSIRNYSTLKWERMSGTKIDIIKLNIIKVII